MIDIRLKELRKSRKLTQEQLAKILNIKRATYAKYETGGNEPDFSTLLKIANFFEVSVDYLLGRSNLKSGLKPGKIILDGDFELPDDISDEDLEFVMDILQSALKRIKKQDNSSHD